MKAVHIPFGFRSGGLLAARMRERLKVMRFPSLVMRPEMTTLLLNLVGWPARQRERPMEHWRRWEFVAISPAGGAKFVLVL